MERESWICSICLDNSEINCFILEPCNHKFHTKCLIKSLRKCGKKCPYCRGEDNQDTENVSLNFTNQNMVDIDFDFNNQNILIDESLERAIYRSVNSSYFQ